MSPLDQVAELIPSLEEGRRVVSTYVRARSAHSVAWQYTVVPFSAGVPVPAPIYFDPPTGNNVSGQHMVSAELSLDASWLVVKLKVSLDAAAVAAYPRPWVEVVLCPERSVLPGGAAASRLSVIVLSLGVGADGTAVRPPAQFTVTAKLPLQADGYVSPFQLAIENPAGVPAVVWIADGPTTPRRAYLGTPARLDKLHQDLKSFLGSLGIEIGFLTNNLARLEVDGVLTVDTDQPVTGTRMAITFGAMGVNLPLRMEPPWVPPARPAVGVSGPASGAGVLWHRSRPDSCRFWLSIGRKFGGTVDSSPGDWV